jgi:sugar phosphate isomerase/epimerase
MASVWNALFVRDTGGKLKCDRDHLKRHISTLPAQGIECFEFTWDPPDTMEDLFDEEWRDFLEQCQSEWNLSFAIHLPMFGLDPAAFHKEIAAASMRETIKAIRWTEGLDITGYVLHIGITGARLQAALSNVSPALLSSLWERTVASAKSTLPWLLDHVEPRRIWIENLPYSSLEPLVPAIEEYDFGICLDVGHADRNGEDPAGFFSRHKDRIGEIHFHDVKDLGSPGTVGATTDHQALGTGHIGYQRLLDTFVGGGFEGDLIIEVTNLEDENVSVRRARSYLDNLSSSPQREHNP